MNHFESLRMNRSTENGESGHAIRPPSTVIVAPVMKAACGEARNATSAATSSAVPYRPSGMVPRRKSAAGFLSASAGFISVSMGPGCTSLTVICRAANSRDQARVKPATANLLAA